MKSFGAFSGGEETGNLGKLQARRESPGLFPMAFSGGERRGRGADSPSLIKFRLFHLTATLPS